ncbi:hypothetical protein A3759_12175 [Thalassolituus sp. HI0120]|nr:hypothetical protein A3759_14100 [Thalassolituus sp. HI0120]KZZ44126.1 hypothetical protein A3759_12175 [Thalassolituus sp. HI0120]
MSFKLNVDDFEGQSIQSVVTFVDNSFKKPLSEVSLYDLLINETINKALRHGVYMYFNERMNVFMWACVTQVILLIELVPILVCHQDME